MTKRGRTGPLPSQGRGAGGGDGGGGESQAKVSPRNGCHAAKEGTGSRPEFILSAAASGVEGPGRREGRGPRGAQQRSSRENKLGDGHRRSDARGSGR